MNFSPEAVAGMSDEHRAAFLAQLEHMQIRDRCGGGGRQRCSGAARSAALHLPTAAAGAWGPRAPDRGHGACGRSTIKAMVPPAAAGRAARACTGAAGRSPGRCYATTGQSRR